MESELKPAKFANRRSLAVVPILVTIAVIGNTLVTMMLWDSSGKHAEFFNSLACGMLIAQPCLPSIWCALVKQKLILRVSYSMGILLGLYCTYMLTLGTMDRMDMPMEVPLVCLGIVVALTVLIQTPLYVIRRKTGYLISTDTSDTGIHSDMAHLGEKSSGSW